MMIGSVIAFILIPMCSALLIPPKFIPEIPEVCKNAKICDSIPNYPNNEMEKIIKQLNHKGIRPNKIVSDQPDIHLGAGSLPPKSKPQDYLPPTPAIISSVTNIIGNALPTPISSEADGVGKVGVTFDVKDQDVNLCRTVVSIKYPKAARGKNDKWYYVINSDVDPYQAFHTELCASDAVDKPCGNDNLQIYFHGGYESHCVQRYIWRHVLAVNQTGHVFKLNAEMPSCCNCLVKTVF